MSDVRKRRLCQWITICFLCFFCLLGASTAGAIPYSISVNTSSLAGTPGQLAFDFIDGGTPSNTVTISGFSTTGTMGSSSTTGGVSGTLPGTITLQDTQFFNEYLFDMTFGGIFSFVLDMTTNAPDAGTFPDAFSFFLLEPGTGLSLISTTDFTGANSLFRLDIDGTPGGAVSVYSEPTGLVAWSVAPITTVPEPMTILLLGAGFSGVLSYRRISRRRQQRHALRSNGISHG